MIWYIHYMHVFLGLSRSSDKPREVLLFFFFGTYSWETKLYETNSEGKRRATKTVYRAKPIVFFLQKKLMTGRSRFSKNIQVYFAKFIAAYKNSDGEWEKFLTDKGEGSPPVQFNIFIEDGLRTSCADIYVMGTKALRYYMNPYHPCVLGLQVIALT